uniref:glutathione transferase n=1 Tax=Laticauda laticaudata TaxID=8630 RepID=A0A8C5RMC0_LATLA
MDLFFIIRIDMYCEGTVDLNEGMMMLHFRPADTKEKELQTILEKASNRYFPVLKDHGQDFLVGKQLSRADVQLLESILMVEELKADILSTFPLLKAFKGRISNIPTIKKFLQPGSARKPPMDEKIVAEAIKIFH